VISILAPINIEKYLWRTAWTVVNCEHFQTVT